MIERWGRSRMFAGLALTTVVCLVAVVPPVAAIAQSFHPPASEGWSSGAYSYVLSTYSDALKVSIKLAVSVSLASLLVGAPAAYAFARYPFPGSAAVERLATIPLALPGVSVAIAIIIGYGAFRGSWLLLAAGQMLYTVPYVIRIVMNTLRNVPLRELDAAARTLGARRLTRITRVILPTLLHPLVLSALVVFAISWGEFNVSFLLATPTQMPFAAALYGTYTSNSGAIGGAATAIFLAGALPLLIALQFIDRRSVDVGQGA